MSKELPYFKYFPGEWLKGDITICSMAAQGLFINLCSFYWMKDCSMSLANARQRFNTNSTEFTELDNNEIIHIIDGNIYIRARLDDNVSTAIICRFSMTQLR